mgnify:CR=1 FL=1
MRQPRESQRVPELLHILMSRIHLTPSPPVPSLPHRITKVIGTGPDVEFPARLLPEMIRSGSPPLPGRRNGNANSDDRSQLPRQAARDLNRRNVHACIDFSASSCRTGGDCASSYAGDVTTDPAKAAAKPGRAIDEPSTSNPAKAAAKPGRAADDTVKTDPAKAG